MTQNIHRNAIQSVDIAKNIYEIDDKLSSIVINLFDGLKDGKHAVTNQELTDVLKKAAQSHLNWMKKIGSMVDRMELEPLQTNPKKCAFGHFYHAINVTHPKLINEWGKIDELHYSFHTMGDDIIKYVNENKKQEAVEVYKKIEVISVKMIEKLKSAENIIAEMNTQGINVFQ